MLSIAIRWRRTVEHAAAAGRPLALLLIDIDHFKDFNDHFGHAAGDHMLKRIAAEIIATARVNDHIYRCGGEEFVVITEGAKGDGTLALGERIRRSIAGAPRRKEAMRVTASIGIAICPADGNDYDTLFDSPTSAFTRPRPPAATAWSMDGRLAAGGMIMDLP